MSQSHGALAPSRSCRGRLTGARRRDVSERLRQESSSPSSAASVPCLPPQPRIAPPSGQNKGGLRPSPSRAGCGWPWRQSGVVRQEAG